MLYRVRFNNELIGYVVGNFSVTYNDEKRKKLEGCVYNLRSEIISKLGFTTEEEYVESVYGYAKECIKRIDRDNDVLIYSARRDWKEKPLIEIRIIQEVHIQVQFEEYRDWYHSFTDLDRNHKKMIEGGCPCMFLVQPKIEECHTWVGEGSYLAHERRKVVVPDAIWFCEDWDNPTERHKVEMWYEDQMTGGRKKCSLKEPKWRTDEEINTIKHHEWHYEETYKKTKPIKVQI